MSRTSDIPTEPPEPLSARNSRPRRGMLAVVAVLVAVALLASPSAAFAWEAEEGGGGGLEVELSLPTLLTPALLRFWQSGPTSLEGPSVPVDALTRPGAIEVAVQVHADADRLTLQLPDGPAEARLPAALANRTLEARFAATEPGPVVAVFPRGEGEAFLGSLEGTRVRQVRTARADGTIVIFPYYKDGQFHELDLTTMGLKAWKGFGGDWLGATEAGLTLTQRASVAYELEKWLPEALVISLITILWISLLAFFLTRRLTKVPSRTQAALELIVTGLENLILSIIGPHGKRYVPLVSTIFLYILLMNLSGLVPGWTSPTANINVTAALAICVFVYVQYEAIRVNGLWGYAKHFIGEPWWLAPINVPVHILGELARPLSLSLRLFVNIFGEKTVVVVLISLSGLFLTWVPGHFPILFLATFVSFVQALVFTMLTCVYLGLATSHEDEHDHEHHHEEHAHGHKADHAPATA